MTILLTELNEEIELLTEEKNGVKQYTISGRFMVAEERNGNGRVYPKSVLESELSRYNTIISENRAMGELGHPANPTLNLDRVSHLITNLRMEGNIVNGKAKILDTPCGKIAKNLLDEGVRLGVSSRGLGSIKEQNGVKYVQNDFRLMTVDIVADPSGPGCFVESLVENVEWFFDGIEWRRQEQIVESINKAKTIADKKLREAKFLEAFGKFLRS